MPARPCPGWYALHITLPLHLYVALRTVAKIDGTSMSAIIRGRIIPWYEEQCQDGVITDAEVREESREIHAAQLAEVEARSQRTVVSAHGTRMAAVS
jgi:hypothetical protein